MRASSIIAAAAATTAVATTVGICALAAAQVPSVGAVVASASTTSRVATATAAAAAAAAVGMCALADTNMSDVATVTATASAAVAAAAELCVSDCLATPPFRGVGGAPAWTEAVVWGLATVAFTVAAACSRL